VSSLVVSALTTKARLRIVLVVACTLSAGGIFYAAYVTKNPGDAGRGGALAVALSFVVLFLSRGHGTKAYEILTKEAAEVSRNLAKLRASGGADLNEDKVAAIISKTKIDANVQHVQNVYLAWSSAIGTIAWGFADIVAQWLVGKPVAGG